MPRTTAEGRASHRVSARPSENAAARVSSAPRNTKSNAGKYKCGGVVNGKDQSVAVTINFGCKGKGNPIAYALDGFPLHGYTDAAGKEPKDLDQFNGRLRSYVTLNVAGRDIVGFINEAKQSVRDIEASLAGTGNVLTTEMSANLAISR